MRNIFRQTPRKDGIEKNHDDAAGTGIFDEKLIVSQHTVKIHLHSILNILNQKNRQQVATYATS